MLCPQKNLALIPPPPTPTIPYNPPHRFFGKVGSQCPGSQSQGPNTPSFWLLSSWSQPKISVDFREKNSHPSVSIWLQPDGMSGGPSAMAQSGAQGVVWASGSRRSSRSSGRCGCMTRPPPPPPPCCGHPWPTVQAGALLCVDPTRGSDTGTVRGLRWHNRPREM